MSQERFKAEILPIRQKLFHIAQHILLEEEEAEDAVLGPVVGGAELLRDQQAPLSVQLFLIGSEKHDCPNSGPSTRPSDPIDAVRRTPHPTQYEWDSMGLNGSQWD